MKVRTISFLLTTLLITQIVYPQSGWFWQNPLPQGNGLGGLYKFDNNIVYCSNVDNFLKSTNGGENWILHYTGFNNFNAGFNMVDANTGYILVDTSKLIKTVNGGNNWFLVSNLSGVSYSSGLNFVTANIGFILGRQGYLYYRGTYLSRTSNAGVNWYTQISDTSFELYSIDFPSQNTGYIVGSKYIWSGSYYHLKIYKTVSGGVTWDSIQNTINMNAHCVGFIDENTGFIGGQLSSPYGRLLKTTDGGLNWILQNDTFDQSLRQIKFIDSVTGFILGDFSLYRTTDGGQNWTTISFYPFGGEFNIGSICFKNINTGIATGIGGLIIKTTNGGTNWIKKLPFGTDSPIWDIRFSDINTGFAAGDFGTLLKTTNGGVNWNLIQFYQEEDMGPVAEVSSDIWYVGSWDYGKIFKTTNTGLTWDTLYTNLYGMTRLKFLNANTGFGVCKYHTFFKTTNGGQNWLIYNNLNLSQNWAMDFVDENTGYVGWVTQKTTNGGLNWDTVSFGFEFWSSDIQFLNHNTGFLVGGNNDYEGYHGLILKTINGGTNWTSQEITDRNLDDIYMVDENNGFISTESRVFKTTNAGINWYQLRTCSYNPLTVSFFNNPTTGYIVGYNGTIIKTTNGGGGPIGIQPISEEVPTHFVLQQNYPNPFNPSTRIKFSIPAVGQRHAFDVRVVVYDILGREAAVLVNERLSPGTYEAEWNASNFASGIYFYQLSINNEQFETKKMVLLK